ncbi:phosphatase, partial [Streptomyces sp. NPDC001356]
PVPRHPAHGDSLLVLHSDGLPSRWRPPQDPRLLSHDPSVVAAAILRDAGSPARPARDDTSVAVLAPDRRTSAHDSRL